MTERDFLIHYGRVLIAQARTFARRENSHVAAFAFVLLEMAAQARCDAQAITDIAQGDLFT